MIPLSIIYNKGLVRDRPGAHRPHRLWSLWRRLMPGFSRRFMAWMERGGFSPRPTFAAEANSAKPWHLAGKKATKPNTWRDFIASARIPDREQIHRFNSTSRNLEPERRRHPHRALRHRTSRSLRRRRRRRSLLRHAPPGDRSQRPWQHPRIRLNQNRGRLQSPLRHERLLPHRAGNKISAVLVTAGANDPRVDPWQGAKMAARLQADTVSGKPILFRVNYDAGHGLTDTIQQQVSDWTDIFTFFYWNFGDTNFQPAALQPTQTAAK